MNPTEREAVKNAQMTTAEKEVSNTVKQQQITRLLELFDKESRKAGRQADRALWCLLTRYKDDLPELDHYFHKCFRQCDVTDSGHTDSAIWHLLDHSEVFWILFEKVLEETTQDHD